MEGKKRGREGEKKEEMDRGELKRQEEPRRKEDCTADKMSEKKNITQSFLKDETAVSKSVRFAWLVSSSDKMSFMFFFFFFTVERSEGRKRNKGRKEKSEERRNMRTKEEI